MTKRTTDKSVVRFMVCADRSTTRPLRVLDWYWLPDDAHRRARRERESGENPTACVRVGRQVDGEWVTL
jgi:hypothetical protein